MNELHWHETGQGYGILMVSMSERVVDLSIQADKAAEIYGPIRIAHNPIRSSNGKRS